MQENKSKILIVDDSEFDRKLLAMALIKKAGYQLIEARSAVQCLEILEREKVDLVLMDIMMPEVSGSELLEKVRKKFNGIELPIIMITAKADSTDVISALKAGANDYITKPINFDVAISRIQTQLSLSAISVEMLRLQSFKTLSALIMTYNHEINNPLTIAIGALRKAQSGVEVESSLKKADEALWRVADIVKKIKNLEDENHLQFEVYAGSEKMIKVK